MLLLELPIQIYEGSENSAAQTNWLGELVLSEIPAMPAGMPAIEVTFDVTHTGVVMVIVHEQFSKIKNKTTLLMRSDRRYRKETKRGSSDCAIVSRPDYAEVFAPGTGEFTFPACSDSVYRTASAHWIIPQHKAPSPDR